MTADNIESLAEKLSQHKVSKNQNKQSMALTANTTELPGDVTIDGGGKS
jgi:hypothetical protein